MSCKSISQQLSCTCAGISIKVYSEISLNNGQERVLAYPHGHIFKTLNNGQECALAGRGGFEAIPEAQAAIFCPKQGRGNFYNSNILFQ